MAFIPAIAEAVYSDLGGLYYKEFGREITAFEPMTAHGSDRQIIRLRDSAGTTAIGIYNEFIHENRAFIGFSKHFLKNGLNVPDIFCTSENMRSYITEDLGDTTLLIKIKEDKSREFGDSQKELYKQALAELEMFQFEASGGIDYSLCYQFDEFGEMNIEYDFNYFKERFLENFYHSEIETALLNQDLAWLKTKVLEMPRDYFLYRDFQSRNIMLKNDKLYFIDYQSGRKGFVLYDLASLLYDAKAKVPQNIREELAEYYINKISARVQKSSELMMDYFWYFAIMRILQAMGAYGFLGIVKGKQKFLESVPYALVNINYILENKTAANELTYLKKIFKILLNEKA